MKLKAEKLKTVTIKQAKSLERWRLAGKVFVCSWFLLGGLAHFLLPASFLRIMPPQIPYPLQIVYISGAFELLGAIALWHPALCRLAGYGLMLLTVCVTPANIYMWQHAQQFPNIPEWVLLLRLPVQVLLLWIIWWSTRAAKRTD